MPKWTSFGIGAVAIWTVVAINLAHAKSVCDPQIPGTYVPQWHALEADNGARYEIDLKSARHFGSLTQALVCIVGEGGTVGMWFDCANHRAGTSPKSMAYAPPRSIGGALEKIACSEANSHPER